MTRALWTFLGRGFLVLALSGGAVACGDDDDDDGSPTDAGTAGKGGSGGKGGTGGAGGTVSPAQCEAAATTASKNAPIAPACLDCACEKAAKTIASCNEACWKVIQCSGERCADTLTDAKAAETCVGTMCAEFIFKEGGAIIEGVATAMAVGPILTAQCGVQCPPPGAPDAGMEDDGGVDAGQ